MPKLDIKDLMKIYYNILVMLENKSSMLELIRGNPNSMADDEALLLEEDIAEMKESVTSLRGMITRAYGVSTFADVASEVMRWIEEDPYHKLMTRLYGSTHNLTLKAVDDTFSIWSAPKPTDIN